MRYYAYWFVAELPLAIAATKSANFSIRHSSQLSVAGIGNRTQALTIDYLIWGFTLLLLLVTWGFLFSQITWLQSDLIRSWFWAIQILLLFGVYIGYFVLFETWWRGQTPGKRYVKIRVIRDDGQNVGLQQSSLRALLRPIDY